MRKVRALDHLLRVPGDDRGCYPPGPDAADSDCYQSDADVADSNCYPSAPHVGDDLLRSLLLPPRPHSRPRSRR